MGLQFKHITSTATFNATKFSASSGDNTYFTGADPNTQVAGTPDILYKDLVFCKCNGKIYTHGKFYETGDGSNDFTSYLFELTTKNVILSGFDVYRIQSSSTYPWYRRNGGMVYLRNINQIVKVEAAGYETTQMSDPDIQDSIWDNGRYYFLAPVDYTPAQGEEKVCDWSDLVRLSDLEVPMATEYQNGLVKVDNELSSNGTNPVKGSVIFNFLDNKFNFFHNANTRYSVDGNIEAAITYVLNHIGNLTTISVCSAIIRYYDGFSSGCIIFRYTDTCLVLHISLDQWDFRLYQSRLSSGVWGTASLIKKLS